MSTSFTKLKLQNQQAIGAAKSGAVAIGLGAIIVLGLAGCLGTGAAKLSSDDDKNSYAVGYNMGMNLKRQGVEVSEAAFMAGVRDAQKGTESKMTQDEMRTAFQRVEAGAVEKIRAKFDKTKAEGAAYLEKNKAKPGWKVTESGLQYEVVTQGDGATPKDGDLVKVNYVGTLIDGKEFDASAKHGGPAEFAVGQVIPGWTEGLKLMKVGSKYRFAIPSDLAYGEQGAGGAIEPNSALLFEVELLSVSTPPPAQRPKKSN
jgi:FKBP-type peptidyl-prolyl cis-trans isomerase